MIATEITLSFLLTNITLTRSFRPERLVIVTLHLPKILKFYLAVVIF